MTKKTQDLSKEEAEELLQRLKEHYGCPVMPVTRYCDALRQWKEAIEERFSHDKSVTGLLQSIYDVELAITKSSLLYRMIYCGEKKRRRRCPLHDGSWSGIPFPGRECEHGCDMTGWLSED